MNTEKKNRRVVFTMGGKGGVCPRHVGGRYPTPGLWERALQPSPV